MATVFVTKNNNLEEFIEIELVKKILSDLYFC
jgi:hypothetical protein